MTSPHPLRVACVQFDLGPVASFDQFSDRVLAWALAAKDCGVRLLLFPEYFTLPLLALGDADHPMERHPERPIEGRVYELAQRADDVLGSLRRAAAASGLWIAGGSTPVLPQRFPAPAGPTRLVGRVANACPLVSPDGAVAWQAKLHMTRFEAEHWGVISHPPLRVFDTPLGRLAVLICYDVEFPELARAAARAGAQVLLVPSCTEDRSGFLRVRTCAAARAIENQCYVLHAPTVGWLWSVPTAALHYGQASVLGPCDLGFARDGVLAEGPLGVESLVVADLDIAQLDRVREMGTVRTLRDSAASDALAATITVESIA